MKLIDQVTSFKLSKVLRGYGCHQDSLFVWVYRPHIDEYELCDEHTKPSNTEYEYYSAFTSSEIGEMLPPNETYTSKDGSQWSCLYGTNMVEGNAEFAETEVEARAKLLIYLKRQEMPSTKK